jgi:hypothetical protein
MIPSLPCFKPCCTSSSNLLILSSPHFSITDVPVQTFDCYGSMNTLIFSPPCLWILMYYPVIGLFGLTPNLFHFHIFQSLTYLPCFFCHSFRFFGIPHLYIHFAFVKITAGISYFMLHSYNIQLSVCSIGMKKTKWKYHLKFQVFWLVTVCQLLNSWLFTSWHGITSQKMYIFIGIGLRTFQLQE